MKSYEIVDYYRNHGSVKAARIYMRGYRSGEVDEAILVVSVVLGCLYNVLFVLNGFENVGEELIFSNSPFSS